MSRRTVLGAAAGGLVLGGGATAVVALTSNTDAAAVDATPPGETLMYEHGVLKRVLLVYQAALLRLDDDLPLAAESLHGGATIIHDFIEGFHEALEEGYVFPALRSAGVLVPTVDTLLVQHGRGRLITQLLLAGATTATLSSPSTRTRVVDAVGAFVRMYEPHEAREDTVVFPALRSLLGPVRLEALGDTFTTLQDRQLGPGGFTAAVDAVAGLEVALGTNQLAAFTPEAVDPSV